MEEVWRAHKPWVGKKCSQKKINKGGCPKVKEYLCLFTKRKKFEIKSCIDG